MSACVNQWSMSDMEFQPFPKVPRLSREMIITEKIDGTNASVAIFAISDDEVIGQDWMRVSLGVAGPCFAMKAASRRRFITPGKDTDNYGFAGWVRDNAEELVKLGEGVHYGEWWGQGIGRKYGLDHKRFSLFNVGQWQDPGPTQPLDGPDWCPSCCHVVPVLAHGTFDDCHAFHGRGRTRITEVMDNLMQRGSTAAPGFMKPEGIMIYHTTARQYFKKTFDNDEGGKG